MSKVSESVEVNVPVRTAYDQWTQFESFPRFMGGVEEVRQLSDTSTAWRTKIGGVTREFNADIVEQVPDRRVAWRSTDGAHAGQVSFEELDPARTRVTADITFEPEGLVENVGDKLGVVDHRVEGDLERFKEYIESQGAESGAWRGEVRQGRVTDERPSI
ncbi:SRPBCC family protein [Pilimelia anulata]|nr:SRPBCC family protein [Pilimelia anulata]